MYQTPSFSLCFLATTDEQLFSSKPFNYTVFALETSEFELNLLEAENPINFHFIKLHMLEFCPHNQTMTKIDFGIRSGVVSVTLLNHVAWKLLESIGGRRLEIFGGVF